MKTIETMKQIETLQEVAKFLLTPSDSTTGIEFAKANLEAHKLIDVINALQATI